MINQLTATQMANIVMGDPDRITAAITEQAKKEYKDLYWLSSPVRDMWSGTITEGSNSLAQANRELCLLALPSPQIDRLFTIYNQTVRQKIEKLDRFIRSKTSGFAHESEMPYRINNQNISNVKSGFTLSIQLGSQLKEHFNSGTLRKQIIQSIYQDFIAKLKDQPELRQLVSPLPTGMS